MVKYREILRLHAMGVSMRNISFSCKCSKTTVKNVVDRALAKLPGIVGHIYTIAVFVFGWSFFWITDSSNLVQYWLAHG